MGKPIKRIQNVTIQLLSDSDPDTSYLGTYSDGRKGEFSIDRKHTFECASQGYNKDTATIDKLERIIAYLDAERLVQVETYDTVSGLWADGIGLAQDTLIDAQDRVTECDCDESGSWSHRERLYFNPGTVEAFNPLASWIPSETQDKQAYWRETMLKDASQNYDRMESLNSGNWYYIGIRVKCTIVVDGLCQTIKSGGLWGIASDSDVSYLASVEDEELSELRSTLYTLGFSKRAIATAFKTPERKEA